MTPETEHAVARLEAVHVRPASATVPMASWPNRMPTPVGASWYRWRSEPQIAVRSTVTITPSGPGSTGSGTSSTRTSRGPSRTVARIPARYMADYTGLGRNAGSEGSFMTATTDHPSTIDLPEVADEDIDAFFDFEDLWAVIVWNDDVTTFQTVIEAFVEIFGHTVERADQLAWRIHRTGKAVAAVRPKDEAEAAVHALHRAQDLGHDRPRLTRRRGGTHR